MSMTPYQQANGVAAYEPPQQPGLAPARQAPPPPPPLVAQMADWAQGAGAIHQVCEQLSNTSFVPVEYRGKPEEMTAAILTGMEVGLSQMAALRAFSPIKGTAAPKALTLRAIVLSHGHEMWAEEASDTRVVLAGRRRGSQQVQRSEWTMERAQQAGYVGRNAMYKSNPKDMLTARATAELARMIAPDAILGIPYSFEELEDGADPGPVQAVAEQVAPPAPVRRRNAASVLPPQAASEPVVEERQGPVEEPGSTRLDPKGEVLARLVGLLGARMDREAAQAFVSEVVGRPVAHPKDLTHAEARRVLDRLVERTGGPAEVDGDDAAGGGS